MRYFKVSPFDTPIYEHSCPLCHACFESGQELPFNALCNRCNDTLCPCAWCSTLTMVEMWCQECGHYTSSRLCACEVCNFNRAVKALDTERSLWPAA